MDMLCSKVVFTAINGTSLATILGIDVNWILNAKDLSYSPKKFAYKPTTRVVGMVPGMCSLLNHAWESVIWHRLIWAWAVWFFICHMPCWMHEKISEGDGSAQALPQLAAEVQSFDLGTPFKSVNLFYDVDRPYVPSISISILKTISVFSCLKLSKSQQSLGHKALSLICKVCSVPPVLICSQGSATAQPHRTTPAPILLQGRGSLCRPPA